MYLRGLAGTIDIRMPDGYINYGVDNILIADGMFAQGGLPTAGSYEKFMGGTLINGCPLNVLFDNSWLPGQQDALKAAGKTQCLPVMPLPVSVVSVPTYPAPGTIGVQPTTPGQSGSYVNTGGQTYLTSTPQVWTPSPVIGPTGMQTPSAPIYQETSAGPVMDFGLPPEPGQGMSQQASFTDYLPWIGIGIAAIALFKRK